MPTKQVFDKCGGGSAKTAETDTLSPSRSVDMLADALAQEFPLEQRELVRGTFARAVKATSRLLAARKDERAPPITLAEYQNVDDGEFLSHLVTELLGPDPYVSSEALVQLKGATNYRRMLKEAGGHYSQADTAARLGISETAVRKRVERKKMLAVDVGGHQRYPVWQFDEETGDVYPMIGRVLNTLNTHSNAARARFFLTPLKALGGTPIDAIREDRDAPLVLQKAAQFGVQGAR